MHFLTDKNRKINLKNWKLLSVLIAIYSGYLLLTMVKTIYFISNSSTPISAIPFELFLIDWITVVGFILFIAWNTKKMLNKQRPWRTIVAIHFFLAVLLNVGIRFFIEAYTFYQAGFRLNQLNFAHLFRRYMAYIDINYLIYFIMLFVIYAYYYMEQKKIEERKKRILESQLLKTKLQLLTTEIQPHFLFNTLNTIVCLIKEDQDKAINTVIDLSDFLRTVLSLKNEQMVTVKEEVIILNKYIEILKIRFEDQVSIDQNIELNTLEAKIPLLIIQPLVENSIKHGFLQNFQQLKIEIEIKINGEFLQLKVVNDGKPIEPSIDALHQGTGLSNIEQRLEALYENFYFSVENLPNNCGVENLLSIPFSKK